jgi:putative protease
LTIPRILAPAGDKNSFLAAVAAGADAIYCGLKIFSARMEADNFSIEELGRLTRLAHSKGIEVYVAFNSIIKESEQEKVFNLLCKLTRFTDVDALIVQDPAMIPLAKNAGFKKELHLSTLGNCTFPAGLDTAGRLGFKRVVLPREFTIDEIKEMARAVPQGLELEVFIHGALCYSISGRCYWSSWFGGKSSLRGRCVQPCRRIYEQKGLKKRHFSCMDFSSDVLVKILKQIPEITTWKIEGRKKSPHYVYYTVRAYKLLRDEPKKKKQALSYLDYAMGREFSHYNLLSQRIMNPLDHSSETGSGLFAGRIQNPAAPFFIAREALLPFDLLRIGFEDDPSHSIQRVTRAIPKKGKFFLGKS